MKLAELPEELQKILLSVTGKKADDAMDGFLKLEQHHYSRIFWQLYDRNVRDDMGHQVSAKAANELIHQLNSYILAHREKLDKKLSVKNPILIKRPKPPLRQQYSQYLTHIDTLDLQFLKNPDFGFNSRSMLPGSVQNAKFYLGQLLYSALRFGGLVNLSLLQSLLLSLKTAVPKQSKQVVWLELNATGESTSPWIPDPVSGALLPRFYQLRSDNCWYTEPTLKQLTMLTCLRFFLRQSGSTVLAKLSPELLARAIVARLSLTHTACHLPVLQGEEPNLPLTSVAFERLLGHYVALPTTKEEDSTRAISAEPTELMSTPQFSSSKFTLSATTIYQATTDCVAVIRTVRKLLGSFNKPEYAGKANLLGQRPSSLPELSRQVKAHATSSTHVLLPITRLLIEWAALRLTSQNKWSGKLKPSTLITYLSSIFLPLGRTFHAQNPLTFDTATLDEHYLEIIDEAPTLRAQLKKAKILRDFHLFLEQVYHVEPSYVCSSFVMQTSRRPALMVDANILLPSEYQRACELLQKRRMFSKTPYIEHIQLLLLVLGFRCGLRRSEALFLHMADIQTPGKLPEEISELTELFVRPHAERQLKSQSATRYLPLGRLLSATERTWFNEFLKIRQQLGSTDYLFSDLTANRPLDRDTAFLPVVAALQQVTQDAGFRYHRLRHSFVTWTFWYWQRHKYPNQHPLASYLRHDVMEHLEDARAHYFHQASTACVRGELHAISTMAGHASPSMTLLHYLHSMHWCHNAEVWRDYALHLDTTATLLKLPRRTFFHRMEKLGLQGVLGEALAPWASQFPAPQSSDVAEHNRLHPTSEANGYPNAIADFYQALCLFNRQDVKALIDNDSEDISAVSSDESANGEFSLHTLCYYARRWAKDRHLDEDTFENATKLLQARKQKENRAARKTTDKQTGAIRHSNMASYALLDWPKKQYAAKTTHLLLEAFHRLSHEQLQDVLRVGHFIVERPVSWNNCQFRQPGELSIFVGRLTPLLLQLPKRYYLNIDVLFNEAFGENFRTELAAKWQLHSQLGEQVKLKLQPYKDISNIPYAALTLRTGPGRNLNHSIGDYGFYVAMTALYFYYGGRQQVVETQPAVISVNQQQARPIEAIEHLSKLPLPVELTQTSIEVSLPDDAPATDKFSEGNGDIPKSSYAKLLHNDQINPKPIDVSFDDLSNSTVKKKRKAKNKNWWEQGPGIKPTDDSE
ncbi:hypothetical protein ACFO3I_03275 [Rheinheimera marina]|uniref:Tyr recombinase domain-containing protein n=1 Tax=Rheinheimera marina TaxID=1774958 RepID=A0ABV9JH84_9GAMM